MRDNPSSPSFTSSTSTSTSSTPSSAPPVRVRVPSAARTLPVPVAGTFSPATAGGGAFVPAQLPTGAAESVAATIAPTAARAAALRFADVDLPTGVRLRVAEQGPPGGECVVLLHGYSDSSHSWSLIMPLLPERYFVIAPDLRGHGDSERPAAGYTMSDLARDVIALLDARGVGSAVLVGHSMGSFVAREIALLAPERVRGLVLEGSAPSLAALSGGGELEAAIAALSDPVPSDFVREFQLSAVHRPLPEDFFAGALEASGKLPARVWQGLWEGMPHAGAEVRLAAIRVPTLLVWGDRDAIFGRAAQDELLGLIRGARLLEYDDVGHSPHWETPAVFARDLLAFLAARREATGNSVASGSREPGLAG
jgi:non-heme chloroperoxidase